MKCAIYKFLLYNLVQELIHNIIKHARASEVIIQLLREEQVVSLYVEDNGKGFDTATAYAGNGLKNMQSRAAAMQAILRITSIAGAGTTVLLEKQVT